MPATKSGSHATWHLVYGAGEHYPYFMGKGTPLLSTPPVKTGVGSLPLCRGCSDIHPWPCGEGRSKNQVADHRAMSGCPHPVLQWRGTWHLHTHRNADLPQDLFWNSLGFFQHLVQRATILGAIQERESKRAEQAAGWGRCRDRSQRDAEMAGIKMQHFPGSWRVETCFAPRETEARPQLKATHGFRMAHLLQKGKEYL